MLIIIIFALVFACGFFLPWWVLAIICFAAAFWLARSGSQAFWSGLLAVAIAWMLLALFQSMPNNHVLASQVATLFYLPNWMLLLAITGLIGGLVGGFAGAGGYWVQQAFGRRSAEDEQPE
ncbi:hypothetical protein [Mucilaginibacter sp.]